MSANRFVPCGPVAILIASGPMPAKVMMRWRLGVVSTVTVPMGRPAASG
jgi:hypothetical protein